MSSLEEIGALLGFVAFVGLAVLVFLTFQQARHLRRLRDWAGRSPERAAVAAGVEPVGGRTEVQAGSDEPPADAAASAEPSRPVAPLTPPEPRFAAQRAALAEWWAEVDRRMPVEPKLLFGGLAAIILGVGIATGGFGLTGGDESPAGVETSKGSKQDGAASNLEKEKKAKVAVLNGTAPEPGVPGVPGVADRASGDVKSAGFKIGAVTNAGSYTASVIMFEPGAEKDAKKLADAVSALLGITSVVAMTPDIQAVAGGADVALIIGQDDAAI